jgi:hypothetical protein
VKKTVPVHVCKKPYPFKGVQMAFRWRSDGVQKPFGFTQKLRKTLVLGRCVFFDTFTFTRPKWGGSTAIRGMNHPIKLPQTCTSREKVVGRPIGTQTIHKIGDPTKKNEFIDKGFITFHYSGNHLWGLVDSP